jgi:hypothetical protein
LTKEEKEKYKLIGDEAEKRFSEYLDSKDIPFMKIDQEKTTFSNVFFNNYIQRPDFIILKESNNFYVDVKYRTKKESWDSNENKRYYLEHNEIFKLNNFLNKYSKNIILAFTDNLINPVFKYASLSIINDYKDKFTKYSKENHWWKNQKSYKKLKRYWVLVPNEFLFDDLYNDEYLDKKKILESLDIQIEARYHVDHAYKWEEYNRHIEPVLKSV